MNQILNGDSWKLAPTLEDESVDCVITSPPYWGLRDYGVAEQFGLEDHPQQYVDKLVELCELLRPKLKKSGVMFWNIGETYFGNSSYSDEGRQGYEEKTGMMMNASKAVRTGEPDPKLPERLRAREQFKGEKSPWLQPKQLLGLPWRFAIAMQDKGWILRNTIIWYKRNHMPSSVQDRFSNSYEYVFLFCKAKENQSYKKIFGLRPILTNEQKAWMTAMIEADGCISVSRTKQHQTGKTHQYPQYLIFGNMSKKLIDEFHRIANCGSITERNIKNGKYYDLRFAGYDAYWLLFNMYPYFIEKKEQAKVFLNLLRIKRLDGQKQLRLTAEEIKERDDVWNTIKLLNSKKIEKTDYPEPIIPKQYLGCEDYWFDLDSVREPHQWADRDKRSLLGRVEHKSGKTLEGAEYASNAVGYNSKGKNPGDVWDITTKPHAFSHFATFPRELVERMMKAGCPEGGLVLDPFMGSGTVAVVARDLKRNYLGFELNAEYIKIAQRRLAGVEDWGLMKDIDAGKQKTLNNSTP